MFSKFKDLFWFILSACLLILFIFQAAENSLWAAASFLGTILALVRGFYEITGKKEK